MQIRYSEMKMRAISTLSGLMLALICLSFQGCAQNAKQVALASETKKQLDLPTFRDSAQLIRQTYEPQLFTLPSGRVAHYGLRMYRQTLDAKYSATIANDLARIASRLNYFAAEVFTQEQINQHAQRRLESYRHSEKTRSQRRFRATQARPEYLYVMALLGSMARAEEYGLKHKDDHKLREALRRYDFTPYATKPRMIKAWAAQLANQVFWLRQLGEQDVVDEFIAAFRLAYPDPQDASLSRLQYGNKLYGMTHMVFADSWFYQRLVSEKQHQWIFDYFRANIDVILQRAKPDIVAEVGIAFLLAGLNDDPVVYKTRRFIQASIDVDNGMIPSVGGALELSSGGHRNVLAIMLLDWGSVNEAPTVTKHPGVFRQLPYGLVKKGD